MLRFCVCYQRVTSLSVTKHTSRWAIPIVSEGWRAVLLLHSQPLRFKRKSVNRRFSNWKWPGATEVGALISTRIAASGAEVANLTK